MHEQSGDDLLVEMNTTPLIDVLLVLLVMLIITIPIQLHAVNLNMPTASAAPATPVVVNLDIAANGALQWNGEPLADRAALESHLRDVAAQADQPELHIKPDRMAEYRHVAMVLASAQRLGANKLGVVGSERFAR